MARTARGKIQLRRIENSAHRQVTLCKRRGGLLKKAEELAVLCDAHVGLIIFSPHGKLHELATNGSMQGLIERYVEKSGTEIGGDIHRNRAATGLEQEIFMLKKEIEQLQKGLRYLFGGLETITTFEDLHALEKNIEFWIQEIRTTKMRIILQEMQHLKHEEETLKTANEVLLQKIAEQNGIFNMLSAAAGNPSTNLTTDDQEPQYSAILMHSWNL